MGKQQFWGCVITFRNPEGHLLALCSEIILCGGGIKVRQAACKASTLISVLYLQPPNIVLHVCGEGVTGSLLEYSQLYALCLGPSKHFQRYLLVHALPSIKIGLKIRKANAQSVPPGKGFIYPVENKEDKGALVWSILPFVRIQCLFYHLLCFVK